MDNRPPLQVWDLEPEVKAKERGMGAAAAKNSEALRIAREIAKDFARDRDVCIEDVRSGMCNPSTLARLGLPAIKFVPGNWLGSTFKEFGIWEVTGMVHATHKKGHARRVLTYRLRSNQERQNQP